MALANCCGLVAHRYVVAFMSFLGLLVTVGFRTSFALVVTHITVFNDTSEANYNNDSIFPQCTVNGTQKREVHWSGTVIFLYSTAFFAGQFIASVPAGALATRLPTKWLAGMNLLITSILQLLMPLASETAIWLILLFRFIQGIVEASAVPAINTVLSKWTPKNEKARITNIAYSGVYLSPAVAMLTTGATTCYVSWDSIFYIYGGLGVLWFFLWSLLVYPSIDQYPNQTVEERELLEEQQLHGAVRPEFSKLPWKHLFTSMPVLAIWVASFCRNVILAILIVEVQQYYKDVYNLNTALNGVLSAMPHACMTVFMLIASYGFDSLIKKNLVSVTTGRKVAQGLGYGIQGACILAVGFVDNLWVAFTLFCVGTAFSGLAISGFQTNLFDIAPPFVAPLTGIIRSGMVGSVFITVLASQIPGVTHKLIDWQHMFIIAGCIHIAGVIFYLVFASGRVQHWAILPAQGDPHLARALLTPAQSYGAVNETWGPTSYSQRE